MLNSGEQWIEPTTLQPAMIPTIGGRPWITGFSSYVLGEDDPFPQGFTLGDIW